MLQSIRTACFWTLLCLLAAVLTAVPATAQEDYTDSAGLPDDARGKLVREILDAINSGDASNFDAIVGKHFEPGFRDAFPMEAHRGFAEGAFAESQGFDVHGLRTYASGLEKDRIVVILRNRLTEAWEGLVVYVTPTEVLKVRGMELVPARPPKGFAEEVMSITGNDLQGALDGVLDRLSGADAFSGTALIARDGKVLAAGARGLASKAWEAPNRLDTKFNLGSMNKMFTAVAIMQLAEAGKLALDDPASKYLDESWLRGEHAGKVTIAHLLSHRGGLGSYFNDRYEAMSRMLLVEIDDYKPLIAGEEPAFEPGGRFEYSNTGFLLLGKIVEVVSGENYFDYVRTHIHAPAGMADTDCFDLSEDVPNLATGYIEHPAGGGARWRNNTFFHVMRGGPAGGGYSTAEDLLRFAAALTSGKLVAAESLKRLTTPMGEEGYALGFMTEAGPDGASFGHNGGFPGLNSALRIYPESGWVLVTMSNYSNGAQIMMGQLERLMAAAAAGE